MTLPSPIKVKSVEGYTRQDWYKKLRLVRYKKYSSEFYSIPVVNTHTTGRFGEPKIKVRITIEEIQ